MFIKLNTFFSLGLLNVLHVLFYRLRITLGLFLFPKFTFSQKNLPFYTASLFPPLPIQFASADRLLFFGDPNQSIPVLCSPPNWYRNYFSSCDSDSFGVDWWKVPDFDPKLGDIKIIWELSRFHWVVLFAQAVRQGDTSYLSRLNFWLHDWLFQNPPYKGVNWKCGQEVSIRLINLVIALIILKQDLRAPSYLISLIHIHLKRIVPTIKYALAQNNNHGTSEAAALFIGGTLLQLNGFNNGRYFAKLGRRLLENRAFKLISHDGCFSQYSTNYHRLMLDTYSVVEIWRRRHNLAPFSSIFYVKLSSASNWILNMVCSITGECPNTGANDGARLLQLSNTSFRDFRPCVQLSSAIFSGKRAYINAGSWDDAFKWFDIKPPEGLVSQSNHFIDNGGGFAVFRNSHVMTMLRYPRFSFRPSQSDALHLDLWVNGSNVLRDAGSYSYNTEARWLHYFSGTESHNTIQFDDRDQMPRISRFLFGCWLKGNVLESYQFSSGQHSIKVSYKDWKNARHVRSINLKNDSLTVIDEITGFQNKAVLRWRLEPGKWRLVSNGVINDLRYLKVSGSMLIKRMELIQGWESRFYQDKQSVPVLEVEVNQPGILTTEYRWN